MATFKVVLDGIDLTDDQSRQISESIRDAVLHGLADHDAGRGEKVSASRSFGLSMVPIFKGELMGWMMREQELDDQFKTILGREFSG